MMTDSLIPLAQVGKLDSYGIGYWTQTLLATLVIFVCMLFVLQFKKKFPAHTFPERQNKKSKDVLIIGSGILGSAMAHTLARMGYDVTVIERDMGEPDRIVGELLQPGGVRALRGLGLADCVQGFGAHVVKGYVIHDNETDTRVHIPYPKDDRLQTVCGRSFHHGKFVMALRSAAMEHNISFIEATATKLLESAGVITGVQYKQKQSDKLQEVFAPLTIVADGCFSRFRKQLVKETASTKSYFVGTIMKGCPQVLENHAELILAQPSPILIYKISEQDTRILVDIRGKLPRDIKRYMADTIAPQLPQHTQGPFLDSIQNGHIRSMPNSFLPPSPIEKPGVLVLGDALNMRHPLTGGGMSVALNDVLIWSRLFRDIPDLYDYEAVLSASRAFHMQRKRNHSFVVNVLAQALYELFAASDGDLAKLRRACFHYFKLGGECVSGPVGLLSVLTPRPLVLIGHFFCIALYAIYFEVRQHGWWSSPRSFYTSIQIFRKACHILFPLIWTELRTITV